jgi:nitrate/nitrite transporter NarK
MNIMITDTDKRRALPWALVSSALNAVFALWTFGGSLFVLFLSELGLPKAKIGAMLSLFPFCGLLALGFAPVAARLGRKRVFLVCYSSRKLVMAALLGLPWVLHRYGQASAVTLLVGIIVIFAVLRALAETAHYPWAQEYIPNPVRGTFGAWSSVIVLVASGLSLALASHVLSTGTGLARYLALIGAGSLIGLLSVAAMLYVPGGAPVTQTSEPGTHLENMRAAVRDANFRAYLGGMAGVTLGSGMLIAFLPLYAREQLGLHTANVVRLDIVLMIGGALSSMVAGWVSDRVGSRPVLMPCAALLVFVPLGCILLPRQTPHSAAWCAALYFLFGLLSNGIGIASGRLLYNGVTPPESGTAYMAIYYAWMGVTGGIAPLLAGGILSSAAGCAPVMGIIVDGYTWLFAVALLFLAAGWYLHGRVRPDGAHTTRDVMRGVVTRMGWR